LPVTGRFRGQTTKTNPERPRFVHCRKPLDLGLKAAFSKVLRGTIAAYKGFKILIDAVLYTHPPRGLGESNFIKAAECPRGAPPKHPLGPSG
jgi:hypothetical protein